VVTTAKRRPKPRVFADGKGKWQGREPNPAVSGFVDQFVRWLSANVLESVKLTGLLITLREVRLRADTKEDIAWKSLGYHLCFQEI
jgi:hypothetical protein